MMDENVWYMAQFLNVNTYSITHFDPTFHTKCEAQCSSEIGKEWYMNSVLSYRASMTIYMTLRISNLSLLYPQSVYELSQKIL